MSDVFLSYASEDRDRAGEIASLFRGRGWSVWWDRTIPPGRTYDQVIEEALDASRCVVVLWTQASVRSEWVKNEADEGARRAILVPVLLDEVRIPLGFRRIQAANLVGWKPGEPTPDVDLLLSAVAERLGEAPENPPPAKTASATAPPAQAVLEVPPSPPLPAADEPPPVPRPPMPPADAETGGREPGQRDRTGRPRPPGGWAGTIREFTRRHIVMVTTILALGVAGALLLKIDPADDAPDVSGTVASARPRQTPSRVEVLRGAAELASLPGGGVMIYVREPAERGSAMVVGARVEVTANQVEGWSVVPPTSGYIGLYELRDLTGAYRIWVSQRGYHEAHGEFVVEPHRITTVDVTLVPVS